MTIDEDRPGMAERYTQAASTSHLKLQPGRCAVDYLIAAGKTNEKLGLMLWRLRAEFDAVRAEVRPEGEMNHAERVLVLSSLRWLFPCKQRLWLVVLEWLTETPVPMDKEEAAQVAGRVLDAWLDPNCPGCEGRGFNGGTHRGEPKFSCRACRGTKLRRSSIARNGHQRLLADRITNHIAEQLFATEAEMSALLRPYVQQSA